MCVDGRVPLFKDRKAPTQEKTQCFPIVCKARANNAIASLKYTSFFEILNASRIQLNHDRQLYEQAHCRHSGNHCSRKDFHVCESAIEKAYAFTHLHGSMALMYWKNEVA